MLSGAAMNTVFQGLWLLGMLAVAGRLFFSGLHRRYTFFFAYVLLSAFQSAGAFVLPTHSGAYQKFFLVTTPLVWLFYVLVVLELYGLVLEQYPGLLTLGRWAMYGSIGVSVLLSLLALSLRLRNVVAQKSQLLSYYIVIERGLVSSLLIFLFIILILLRNYPVRLSRNVVIHCLVYSAYFLSSTLAMLAAGLFGVRLSAGVNLFISLFNAACAFVWAFFLNRQGEKRLVSVSKLSAEQEERIMAQLNALNTTVLRVSRK
jgi:hypothetical protein